MARRRRWPLALLLPGLVLVGGSFWWRSTMVDRLVTLPDDLNVTANYEGTVTLYVDKTTNMPLAAPEVHELTVTRTVKANPELTTKDKIVILESIKLFSPGLFDSVQEHQYVMDRKTAVNIDDPLAWGYTPDNPVSRAGAYRLAFPFHMESDKTYSVYKEELDSTYTPTMAGEFDTEGLATLRFDGKGGWAPADAAYLADVSKNVKLPKTLGFEQMKPILKAKGFDVDAAIVALLPALAPDDVTTIMGAANTPVVLQYVDSFEGSTFVDPLTGSPVNVSAVSETLGAVPEPESVRPLIDTLKKYPNVPVAVTAVQALEAVAGEPIPIYTSDYHQTAASVAEAVADAKESGRMMRMAETWIPNGMAAFGGFLALVGLLLILIPKRRAHVPMSALTPAPVEVVPELAPFETVATSTVVDRDTVLH